ncbi:hypothetical protein MCEMRE182_00041 [Candidatus Nanopelagicaceae bacterium]
MNLNMRSLKGKVRQRRKLLFSDINSQVNLASENLLRYGTSIEEACQGKSEKFEILLLASAHDLPLAIANAKHMLALHGDEILKVSVICQNPVINGSEGLTFLTDDQFGIGDEVQRTLKRFGARTSWMKQQYLKSKFVHSALNPVLILDSDTFLNIPFTWLKNDTQILLVNTEDFHIPYNLHISKFLRITPPALNFVSHVQLQQPAIVREIYSSDFDAGWSEWANSSWKFGEDSPASEFQTYASYLLSTKANCRIVIPRHTVVSGKGTNLTGVLIQDAAKNSEIVTIGEKTLLVSEMN